MLWAVVVALAGMVVFQYLFNLLYTAAFIKNRMALIKDIIDKPLASNTEFHIHVCLDRIPAGYEAIIKTSEISLFYISLLIGIILVSPAIALTLVLLLVVMTFTMLLKVHTNSEVRSTAYDARYNLEESNYNLIKGMDYANFNFTTIRNSAVYSELFGGIGIVLIMLFYLLWFSGEQLTSNNLLSLILVLSIRFVINYTGEFSRLIGSIIEQQDILKHLNLNNLKNTETVSN